MRLLDRITTAAKIIFGQMRENPYTSGFSSWGGVPTKSGASISEANAMQLSVVWACVKILSEDTASLPLILYRRTPNGGKERATDHPLYSLMHDQPNPEMTAFSFREAYMSHLLTWGNAYAEKIIVKSGAVVGLWPITPNRVMVYRDTDKQLAYRISVPTGGTVDLPKNQILHTPGLGFNGLYGFSPVYMAREAMGLGKTLEEFGATYFQNGIRPSFVVSVTGKTRGRGEKPWKRFMED
jgi:HK97 family phage portal protein